MRRKNKGKKDISVTLAFIFGVLILFYPKLSNVWNQVLNRRLTSSYNKTVSNMDESDRDRLFTEALTYNRNHKENKAMDAFNNYASNTYSEYEELLDPLGNGIMGSLIIPEIGEEIPIYHGLGDKALEKGCGHMEGTSLPVGGKGSHSVMAAHRGLPSAKLFTDLDKMEIGNVFYIKVLGRTHAYQVDQIKVVLPENGSDLLILGDNDYVTLVTCTPYAVNTHRLLVRGKRIPYKETKEEEILKRLKIDFALKLLLFALAIIFLIVWITKEKTASKKE